MSLLVVFNFFWNLILLSYNSYDTNQLNTMLPWDYTVGSFITTLYYDCIHEIGPSYCYHVMMSCMQPSDPTQHVCAICLQDFTTDVLLTFSVFFVFITYNNLMCTKVTMSARWDLVTQKSKVHVFSLLYRQYFFTRLWNMLIL